LILFLTTSHEFIMPGHIVGELTIRATLQEGERSSQMVKFIFLVLS
jgi:hypothetical protein